MLRGIDKTTREADSSWMAIAYVYVRFSDRQQARGDSVRRQTAAAARYTATTGDTLIELQIEEGKSAFTGANLTGVLGDFLDRVASGSIAKGSKLLLEKFDRLSRQHHEAAHDTFRGIIRKGITVVTLHNGKEYSSGMTVLETLQALIEMDLAHQESKTKSMRVKESWARRRADGGPVTSVCPKWLRPLWFDNVEAGHRIRTTGLGTRGKFAVIPERAKLVKKIFSWLTTGMSPSNIATKLNRDGVPAWQGHRSCQGWHAGYINKMRQGRTVLGEFQASHMVDGKRIPIGKPVKSYYPAVIAPELWEAAQSVKKTSGRPGRKSREVNLFSGLLYSWVDGTRFGIKDTAVRSKKNGDVVHYTYIVSLAGRLHRRNTHSIRYEAIENDLLHFIKSMAPQIFRQSIGDPIQEHKDNVADARTLLDKAQGALDALLDLAEKGITPDLHARLVMRTADRDAHKQRLQELEEFRPQTLVMPKLDGLNTVEGRRRARIEIARVITKILVNEDGSELLIHTRWFKEPIYLEPRANDGDGHWGFWEKPSEL